MFVSLDPVWNVVCRRVVHMLWVYFLIYYVFLFLLVCSDCFACLVCCVCFTPSLPPPIPPPPLLSLAGVVPTLSRRSPPPRNHNHNNHNRNNNIEYISILRTINIKSLFTGDNFFFKGDFPIGNFVSVSNVCDYIPKLMCLKQINFSWYF